MPNGLADGFLPVRLVGSTNNEETFIGDFPKGVALQAMSLVDVESQMPIAYLTKVNGTGTWAVPPVFVWQVPSAENKIFKYIFIQVMPSDAPVTLDVPGEGRQLFH